MRFLKKITHFAFLFSFIFSVGVYADEQQQNKVLSNKQVVENMFQTFANVKSTPESFSKYISRNYVQNSDGHKLNYNQFLEHVQELHNVMRSIHFKFDQIVSEGNVVATHHIAYGIKKNGNGVKTEFFAFFTIKNHKIIRCAEVSKMIRGSAADKNLSYTKSN